MIPELENFERAFSTNSSGIVRDCRCGTTFYKDDSMEHWEIGEFERLERNPKAKRVAWNVATLRFGGQEYVIDCPCWHEPAIKCIAWLNAHGPMVADWFALEKKRKLADAEKAPVITL